MSRVLAIDYGDVRVGLAISDELGITAQGLDTLTINGNFKKLVSHIVELKKQYDITKIVIGYPKNMDGTESKKSKIVDEIAILLEDKLSFPVIKWDERLTTVSAYKTMRELGIPQKKKNLYADKLAATYILEGYLQSIKNIKKCIQFE